MKRLILGILLVVLLISPSAGAVTLVNPDGAPSPYQRWAQQSKIPTVRERIVVQPSAPDCPAFAACSDLANSYHSAPTIEIDPARANAGTLEFELGHWFALDLLTVADRATFTHLSGSDGRPWWATTNPPDQGDSVEGVFAGTYSFCAHYPASFIATDHEDAVLCAFIAATARAHPGAVDLPVPTRPAHHRARHHRAPPHHYIIATD